MRQAVVTRSVFNLPSASSSSAGRNGKKGEDCLRANSPSSAAPRFDRAAQSTRRSRATQRARLLLGKTRRSTSPAGETRPASPLPRSVFVVSRRRRWPKTEPLGSAPDARVAFSCFAKKKLPKRRRPRVTRSASPTPLRYSASRAAAELGATPLKQSSPTTPGSPPLLGAPQGGLQTPNGI